MEQKSILNSKDLKLNSTPLLHACMNQKITPKIIKYLIEEKCDLNCTFSFKQDAVYLASKNHPLIHRIKSQFGNDFTVENFFGQFPRFKTLREIESEIEEEEKMKKKEKENPHLFFQELNKNMCSIF